MVTLCIVRPLNLSLSTSGKLQKIILCGLKFIRKRKFTENYSWFGVVLYFSAMIILSHEHPLTQQHKSKMKFTVATIIATIAVATAAPQAGSLPVPLSAGLLESFT